MREGKDYHHASDRRDTLLSRRGLARLRSVYMKRALYRRQGHRPLASSSGPRARRPSVHYPLFSRRYHRANNAYDDGGRVYRIGHYGYDAPGHADDTHISPHGIAPGGHAAEHNPFLISELTNWPDVEGCLYYYGYRFYSPGLGRWMSRDPIGQRGGRNLYGFCDSSPIARADPVGLEWRVRRDITPRSWGLFVRGHTSIDEWNFLYLAGPSPRCKKGCNYLNITDVRLLLTVHLPENASESTILHEFDHVFDLVSKLHNEGKKSLQTHSGCYKSSECIVKALANYALPMLQDTAVAYTVQNTDFPDSNIFTRPRYEEQYYGALAGAEEMKMKLENALRDCEE